MADAKTTYLATQLVNHVFGGAVYVPPATLYLGLLSALANPNAGVVTEVAGNGYARQPLSWTRTTGTATTNATVFFPEATGAWPTTVGAGVYDAPVGGNLLYWTVLADAVQITEGGRFELPAGAITVTET